MIEFLCGDSRLVLRTLPDESVHCCVTSPPYFGLRNYNVDGQIGLEKTPDAYVSELVNVFREVRRVLRNDGTLWLNLGDTYAQPGSGGHGATGGADKSTLTSNAPLAQCPTKRVLPPGLKQKDLIGIPWRVAFALQADGWFLRSAIPWIKRNPMPESVTDRPGSAVEYVFLFSKSESYFYDAEAVKMAGVIPAGTKGAKGSAERAGTPGVNSRPPEYKVYDGKRNLRNSDFLFKTWQGLLQDDETGEPLALIVNTKPYKGAHFAVFPPKLVEPCIRAGTSEMGWCEACGSPFKRTLGPRVEANGRGAGNGFKRDERLTYTDANGARGDETPWVPKVQATIGWTCPCKVSHDEVDFKPCTVLDPFAGSGTTGEVAQALGRDAILIDLNPDYLDLARSRCHRFAAF